MKKKERTFKKIIGKLHLWLGLSSGLVVFIVALTGCIYVFSQEITHTLRKDAMYVNSKGAETLPVSELWENTQKKIGNEYEISSVHVYNDPEKNWTFNCYESNEDAITYFGAVEYYQTIYVNPYTGAIAGMYDEKHDFFNLVKFLHWSLLLSTDYGQPIVGWATFIFVLMLISGIILWWPRKKNAVKQRFTFGWKKSTRWKRKNYDLHNVLGFYMASVLLIVAFTGMVWAFSWFEALVYVVSARSTTPPVYLRTESVFAEKKDPRSIDFALKQAKATYPNTNGYSLSEGDDSTGVINVYVQQNPGTYYISHSMQFDKYTGAFLGKKEHKDKNFGEKVITANYDIHVGAILGIPGKILAFIASFICSTLPVTGFIIWWGRRNKERKHAPSYAKN